MVKLSKTKELGLSAMAVVYSTPVVKVVNMESEGIVCASVVTISNEDFTDGGSYEI